MNADTTRDEPELFPAPAARAKSTTRRARPKPEVVAAEASLDAEAGPAGSLPPPTLGDLRAAGERFVRERPLLAMSLAIGLGYLVGRLRR